MLKKVYYEITNVCNLACSFCHGTKRAAAFVTEEQFALAAGRLRPFCNYLYFHLMGEPLLHPLLPRFFEIAEGLGFKVIITTNGTLLKENEQVLLEARALHKLSVSLHAYEANALPYSLEKYLEDCFDFLDKASAAGKISVMRLWNIGGKEELNERIIKAMNLRFDKGGDGEWQEVYSGYRIRDKLFLEWGRRFEWPDINGKVLGDRHACYGLRDQIGVLCDGTVVPCCLDAEGDIALGNIYETPLEDILSTPRAVALKQSFENRCVKEKLCLRCGYAYMTKTK